MTGKKGSIDTYGGTYVEGHVHVERGDFVGRDQIVHNINYFVQQATSAVQEAERAHTIEFQRLAEGVRDYAWRMAEVAASADEAAEPYKGLLAYRLSDAERFLGRDQAIVDLLGYMGRGRLTILQAESGAGKSSLLQAGISPVLLENGHLPVIVRPYDKSPGRKIKQVFLPDLAQTPRLAETPLREFLHRVTGVLGPAATLYLLVDQFEEFLTLLVDKEERSAFVDELAECLEDESLEVRWVLAVRSEFFGDLATFRPRIRNPFENDYRLNRMTPEEAQAVIVEPAARRGLGYEPTLVQRLLADLKREDGQIDPPQIQLVCLALYHAFLEMRGVDPGLSPTITNEIYQQEGGSEGILRGHLNRVLRRELRTPRERELARQLLVALVSSKQRRVRRTRSDLARTLATGILAAQSLDSALMQLDPVLGQLVESRLLNVEREEEAAESSYELAHDYLLTEITVDPEVQAQKAAQEMLDQEVTAWEKNKKLRIAEDRLDIIEPQESKLVLSEEAATLLRLSRDLLKRRKRIRLAGAGVAAVLIALAIFSVVTAIGATRLADRAQVDLGTAIAGIETAQIRAAEAAESEAASVVAASTADARLAAANESLRWAFDGSGVIPVGSFPVALASAGGYLWVANSGDEQVRAIDPHTGILTKTVAVDGRPSDLAFDGGRLWVANASSATVQAIDPDTGEILMTVPTDPYPGELLLEGETLWVKNADSLQALDTRTGLVERTIPVCCDLWGLAAADGRVWTYAQNALQEIDPASGEVETHYLIYLYEDEEFIEYLGEEILDFSTRAKLSFDGTDLWIAVDGVQAGYHPDFGYGNVSIVGHKIYTFSPYDGEISLVAESEMSLPSKLYFDGVLVWATGTNSIWSIEPDTGFTTEPILVGTGPAALLLDGPYLWVANRDSNTVVRVQWKDALFPPVSVGRSPCGLAYDGQDVWVSNQVDGTVQRVRWPTPSQPIPVGAAPCALVFAKGRLWVANQGGPSLQVIDPRTGETLKTFELERTLTDLAFDGTRVWVTHELHEDVLGINAESLEIEYRLRANFWRYMSPHLEFDGTWLWLAMPETIVRIDPAFPEHGQEMGGVSVQYEHLTSDGGLLWLVERSIGSQAGDLVSLDPGRGTGLVQVSERLRFPLAPGAIAFDGQRLWAASGNTVQAVDPEMGVVDSIVPVGREPGALLFDGRRLWIANSGDNTVQYLLVRR